MRTDVEADEVVVAEDIIVAVDYGFDVMESRDGISFDDTKVDVSYYADKGSFDGNVVGEYDTYYKVTPVSGKEAYLVRRVISVREPETVSSNSASGDATEREETEPEEAEPDEGELAKGEIVEPEEPLHIMMASALVLKASATAEDSMKVSYRRDTFFREICTGAKKALLVRQEQKVFDIVPTVRRLCFKLSVQL